jgi:hypothetical protein
MRTEYIFITHVGSESQACVYPSNLEHVYVPENGDLVLGSSFLGVCVYSEKMAQMAKKNR